MCMPCVQIVRTGHAAVSVVCGSVWALVIEKIRLTYGERRKRKGMKKTRRRNLEDEDARM